MRRYFALIAFCFALLCLAPLTAFSAARVDVEGTPQQDPASQINMTRVFAYLAVSGNPFMGQYIETPVECVFFINTAAQPAKHVRFYFAYTATEGPDSGTVIDRDFIDIRGTFAPGVAQETYPPKNAPVTGKQCRNLPGRVLDGKFWYDSKRVNVTLSGYATEVDYADGTSWHSPAAVASPAPSPTPSGTLLATIKDVTRGPVEPTIAIDSTCYGSNFNLGTGNVPFNTSGRASTVVNIWAELPSTGKAVAWIAKTESGEYWVQFDGKAPQRTSGPTALSGEFQKLDATTRPCYTHDLPSKYAADVGPNGFPTPFPTNKP